MWLDRFSSLYTDTDSLRNGDSDYFCEQERLRLANVHSRNSRYDSIKRRWHAVHAFNPLSSKASRLRNSDHVRYEYNAFNIILEHRWNKREWPFQHWEDRDGMYKFSNRRPPPIIPDRWYKSEWLEYYPRGVLPFGHSRHDFDEFVLPFLRRMGKIGDDWEKTDIHKRLLEDRKRYREERQKKDDDWEKTRIHKRLLKDSRRDREEGERKAGIRPETSISEERCLGQQLVKDMEALTMEKGPDGCTTSTTEV
jgi:hypothetical protein